MPVRWKMRTFVTVDVECLIHILIFSFNKGNDIFLSRVHSLHFGVRELVEECEEPAVDESAFGLAVCEFAEHSWLYAADDAEKVSGGEQPSLGGNIIYKEDDLKVTGTF